MTAVTARETAPPPTCWSSVRRLLAKPFKRSSYKVRKTHSDPLEVEASHRPRFERHRSRLQQHASSSPTSQSQSHSSQSSHSRIANRSDRFSAGGFLTTVSSTSSFDGASYEAAYEASLHRTNFLFYCGCDTPTSQDRSSSIVSLEDDDVVAERDDDDADAIDRQSFVTTTPKLSHKMPVFFSPRNAVPMLPKPSHERKEKPVHIPQRRSFSSSSTSPFVVTIHPMRSRGTDAL